MKLLLLATCLILSTTANATPIEYIHTQLSDNFDLTLPIGSNIEWQASFNRPPSLLSELFKVTERDIYINSNLSLEGTFNGTATKLGEFYDLSINSSIDTGAYNQVIPDNKFSFFKVYATESETGPSLPVVVNGLAVENTSGPIQLRYNSILNKVDATGGVISGTLSSFQSGNGTISGGLNLKGYVQVDTKFELYRPEIEANNKKLLSEATVLFKGLGYAINSYATLTNFKDYNKTISNGGSKTLIIEPVAELINSKYQFIKEFTGEPNDKYLKEFDSALNTVGAINNAISIGKCISGNFADCGVSGAAAWAEVAAAGADWLASDPPDTNYKTLPVYENKHINVLPGMSEETKAYIELTNSMYDVASYIGLATASLEKYQGAALNNDLEWAEIQFKNYKSNELNFKESVNKFKIVLSESSGFIELANQIYLDESLGQLEIALKLLKNDPELANLLIDYIELNDASNLSKINTLIAQDIDVSLNQAFELEEDQVWDKSFSLSAAENLSNFTTIPAVPEPETYIMFISGLGLLGFVSRRRKIKHA